MSNGPSVAQALEIQMKKKILVIGGITAATLLVGGWALAQSGGHGPGEFGHGGMGAGMHGQMEQGMRGQMSPGMYGQMGQGMRGQMGSGMMGMGRGIMGMDEARAAGQVEAAARHIERGHAANGGRHDRAPGRLQPMTQRSGRR
jgi:hypothetical protein